MPAYCLTHTTLPDRPPGQTPEDPTPFYLSKSLLLKLLQAVWHSRRVLQVVVEALDDIDTHWSPFLFSTAGSNLPAAMT